MRGIVVGVLAGAVFAVGMAFMLAPSATTVPTVTMRLVDYHSGGRDVPCNSTTHAEAVQILVRSNLPAGELRIQVDPPAPTTWWIDAPVEGLNVPNGVQYLAPGVWRFTAEPLSDAGGPLVSCLITRA